MKITAKKSTLHKEVVTIQEWFEVRVQLKPRKIVTIEVAVEDGEVQNWQGNTPADRNVINSLKPVESNYLGNFLEEQTWS